MSTTQPTAEEIAYKAAFTKATGLHPVNANLHEGTFGLGWDMSIEWHLTETADLRRQNTALRVILAKVVAALANGGKVSTDCSEEFLANIPNEVSLAVRDLRRQLEEAQAALRLWIEEGRLHESFCPEDDTCDCEVAKAVNQALNSPCA